MSLSQVQQPEDLHDQIVILVGSAIRLLNGEAGVFVVSNEAFDPLSSAEYTAYRLSDAGSPSCWHWRGSASNRIEHIRMSWMR